MNIQNRRNRIILGIVAGIIIFLLSILIAPGISFNLLIFVLSAFLCYFVLDMYVKNEEKRKFVIPNAFLLGYYITSVLGIIFIILTGYAVNAGMIAEILIYGAFLVLMLLKPSMFVYLALMLYHLGVGIYTIFAYRNNAYISLDNAVLHLIIRLIAVALIAYTLWPKKKPFKYLKGFGAGGRI